MRIKNFVFIIFSLALSTIVSCGQQQNNTSENQAENILLEFYTKHFKIWETPSLPSNVRYEKLDSLMQKYCTAELRNEAKEPYENVGVDILTYNLVSVELNENLKVEADAGKENSYKISFTATYKDVPGGPIKEQVVLHVTVVKEGEYYKIASVVGNAP
jgi:hypothetical protein